MALIPLRAQVREKQETVVGWLLHKVLLLVPRSPTPRTNCSSRPPMAPEGLGATARSPTVLLYAAKKAERTSCRRVSRSLRAASLWRGEKNKCLTMGRSQHPHPHVTMLILLSSSAQETNVCPVVTLPYGSGPKHLILFPS